METCHNLFPCNDHLGVSEDEEEQDSEPENQGVGDYQSKFAHAIISGGYTESLADTVSDHLASDSEGSSEEEDGVNNEDEQNSGINIA